MADTPDDDIDDAEEISVTDKPELKKKKRKNNMNKQDNFVTMGIEGLKSVNWKLYFLLFILFIVITCDVFTDRCLSGFKGAVDGTDPTSYGVILQGIFLVLFFIMFDYLCRFNYI